MCERAGCLICGWEAKQKIAGKKLFTVTGDRFREEGKKEEGMTAKGDRSIGRGVL